MSIVRRRANSRLLSLRSGSVRLSSQVYVACGFVGAPVFMEKEDDNECSRIV